MEELRKTENQDVGPAPEIIAGVASGLPVDSTTQVHPDGMVVRSATTGRDAVVSADVVRQILARAGISHPPPMATEPPVDPVLLTISQAAAAMGISRAMFFKLYNKGRVPPPIKLAERCPRWGKDELREWVAAGCPSGEQWAEMRKKDSIRKGVA